MPKKIDQSSEEWENWSQFNKAYLRQTLQRMINQKLISVVEKNGKTRVTITDRGKRRILEYALEEMTIQKKKSWDKKWRMVIYDIPQSHKRLQQTMRRTLKNLGFLSIQKSIYLTPYPCYKEIEFLREYYEVGPFLKYMLVSKLEDDSAYKEYFGLS